MWVPAILKLEPKRPNARTEIELPIVETSATDIAAPNLENERIDIEEPMRVDWQMLAAPATRTSPMTDAPLPILPKARTLNDDPMLLHSAIDALRPTLKKERTESALEQTDPPITESFCVEPIMNRPMTLRLLPNRTKLLIDMDDPAFVCAITESMLPKRAKLLTDIDDAAFTSRIESSAPIRQEPLQTDKDDDKRQ
jgi:hypothetical protein